MHEDDRRLLEGVVRLAGEGTSHAAEVVEEMHARISPLGGRAAAPGRVRARGISGLVYRAVRATAGAASALLARGLRAWPGRPRPAPPQRREALRSVLNGVSGHHLAERGNPLALPMSLHAGGAPLALERDALRAAFPAAGSRLLVLVHGLCLDDRSWHRRGHDHGAALARDLGYTPVYVRYNTGLHVTDNGRALAELLERLVAAWPRPLSTLTLLCHSMGGLVARSACHHAAHGGMRWPAALRHLVFLGTPHDGAPLERAGNRLHRALAAVRVTAPLARVGAIRSAGITDLRFGNVAEPGGDGADRFAAGGPLPRPVPLPDGVECFWAAATLGRRDGDLRDRVLGDGLVPVPSALGRSGSHGRPADPAREWVGHGMGHLDLLSDPRAYRRIRDWLTP